MYRLPPIDEARYCYPTVGNLAMASATLTSKGQVTLPKSARERLGVEAGDRLEFIELEQGFLAKPVTIEAMNHVIRKIGRMPSIRRSARA
jgi:antitoxin PrlF